MGCALSGRLPHGSRVFTGYLEPEGSSRYLTFSFLIQGGRIKPMKFQEVLTDDQWLFLQKIYHYGVCHLRIVAIWEIVFIISSGVSISIAIMCAVYVGSNFYEDPWVIKSTAYSLFVLGFFGILMVVISKERSKKYVAGLFTIANSRGIKGELDLKKVVQVLPTALNEYEKERDFFGKYYVGFLKVTILPMLLTMYKFGTVYVDLGVLLAFIIIPSEITFFVWRDPLLFQSFFVRRSTIIQGALPELTYMLKYLNNN